MQPGCWNDVFEKLFRDLDAPPVLVDIGASGQPPSIWDPIAPYSVFVGFEPDRRDLADETGGQFQRRIIINQAVTSTDEKRVRFYLTEYPHCSSTLEPNPETLSEYLFADLFRVQGANDVPAVSLNNALQELKLERIDWLKVDSQGTDLRLFQSISPEVRDRILAVDLEPGLIPGYRGEDVFADVHTALTEQGFWLSGLPVRGTVRMRKTTVAQVKADFPELNDQALEEQIRISPFWCEPRYLRSIEWIRQQRMTRRDFVTLWIFAILDGQVGFALDLALQYRTDFGNDTTGALLLSAPVHYLIEDDEQRRKRRTGGYAGLRRLVPRLFKNWIKKLVLPGPDMK